MIDEALAEQEFERFSDWDQADVEERGHFLEWNWGAWSDLTRGDDAPQFGENFGPMSLCRVPHEMADDARGAMCASYGLTSLWL